MFQVLGVTLYVLSNFGVVSTFVPLSVNKWY